MEHVELLMNCEAEMDEELRRFRKHEPAIMDHYASSLLHPISARKKKKKKKKRSQVKPAETFSEHVACPTHLRLAIEHRSSR